MKRCVYLFLLSILLVAGLTACGSGKAEQEVPSLTEIEGMTNDEAAEALSGFCRQDILDAWGKPGGGICAAEHNGGPFVDAKRVTRPDFRKVSGPGVNINCLGSALTAEGEDAVKAFFVYDAPTLGGWVIVQYDIPATTSTDTDLNALPVSWVSLPAVS